jgi:hypothetical protein
MDKPSPSACGAAEDRSLGPPRDLQRARGAEIENLRGQIDRHNCRCRVLDSPEITDAGYEASHSPEALGVR